MRKYFWLDEERCDTYGINLQGPVTFGPVAPGMESIHVPGRNGDLHYWDESYNNVQGTVACYALDSSDIGAALRTAAGWLYGTSGYRRLETSDEPGYYREATVISGPENSIRGGVVAPFEIQFDCKPQKYLTSGEETTSYTVNTYITNPTKFAARPLIRAYGTGTFQIGNTAVKINSADEYTDIDCELMDCYKGTANCNGNVELERFPTLEPGNSSITMTGITQLDITPRWWTL